MQSRGHHRGASMPEPAVSRSSHSFKAPTDSLTRELSSSSLYTLLPAIIQNRVPKFASLRRSTHSPTTTSYYSGWQSPAQRTRAAGDSRPATSSGLSYSSSVSRAGSATPPPAYLSCLQDDVLLSAGADSEDTDDSTEGEVLDDAMEPSPSSVPLMPAPTLIRARHDERDSRVVWRYAEQGLSLLTQSFREASSSNLSEHQPNSPSRESAVFARQLYLHAIAYLVRGLPEDLTFEESLSLRSALPPELSTPVRVNVDSNDGAFPPGQGSGQAQEDSSSGPDGPSVLHRLLAVGIVQFCILVHFLLPYAKMLAQALWKYERQHRITERVVGTSVDVVDVVGRMVYRVNGGKLGRLLEESAGWWMKGIVGGLQDGIGEGMSVFGVGETGHGRLQAGRALV